MAFLFGGGRPSGAEAIREFQRQVSSSSRGTDREIGKLNTTERSVLRELRGCGASGNMELAKIKARELIRLRAHRGRLFTVRANMTGLAQQLGEVHSSQRTTDVVCKMTRMLQSLNGRMDASAIHQMLCEFQRQNDLMSNKQEVMDETLDSAFEAEGEACATDDAVAAVFQEAGLDASLSLARAGHAGAAALQVKLPDDEDMEARLQRLR